jgi:hypothetical protein
MNRKRLTTMFAIAACGVMLTGAGIAAAITAAPVARAGADVPAARAATEARPSGDVFLTDHQNDDLPGATVWSYRERSQTSVAR